MPNLCIIGRGKLGQAVHQAAGPASTLIGHADAIPLCDLIVCATPGAEFLQLIDRLFEVNRPVIIASTGHAWPVELDRDLRHHGLSWVYGGNFSLVMQVLRQGMQRMSRLMKQTGLEPAAILRERHDITKRDAPSGTALLWQEWMGTGPVQIESLREAGATPRHDLSLNFASEKVQISHDVKDRMPYAEGIIWLSQRILAGEGVHAGLQTFESVFDSRFNLQD